MILAMILIFVLGYVFIALEHKVRIDKAAVALVMCGLLWTVYSLWASTSSPTTSPRATSAS